MYQSVRFAIAIVAVALVSVSPARAAAHVQVDVPAANAVLPESFIIGGWMLASAAPFFIGEVTRGQFDQLYDDTWVVSANNGTATAFPGNNGETRTGRIDYIFASKNAVNLTVESSQVYDTRDANGKMPSDQRPVLTTFIVN